MSEISSESSSELKEHEKAFQAHVTTQPDSEIWREAEKIEAAVFEGEDFIKDLEELRDGYGNYVDKTTMIALYDGDRAIGALRIIDYDQNIGFKTINDAQKGLLTIDEAGQETLSSVNPDKVVETGTIGIDKEYRFQRRNGIPVGSQLYGIMYTYAHDNEKTHVIASYDERRLASFKRRYGESVTHLGPGRDYVGSITVPVLIDIEKLGEALRKYGEEEAWLEAGHEVIVEDKHD